MTAHLTPEQFIAGLVPWMTGRRRIVALAGPPASGKSTLAEHIVAALNAQCPGVAALLPLDGFHYDDQVLEARGQRAQKGAQHTFDLDGYRAMLQRLRADAGCDVAAPAFDRAIEIARSGALIIAAPVRIVVTEGNWLLLDAPGWRTLAALFDRTATLAATEAALTERLTRRWTNYGYTPAQLQAKLDGNDLPNVRLAQGSSLAADVIITTG